MPLNVIKVNYGKQESIFEKLNPFVDKLVSVYKQKKQNEWDNEWMSAMLTDIEIAGSKKSIDASILKKDPPEGYIDVEGMTLFADEAVGMLQQKEAITGGITPTATPQATGEVTKQQTEMLPDVKEFNELYQFVSELPTGRIDWSNTRGVFKKRLESGRAIGAAAGNILNMIAGQGITDQRAKFEQDFNLAAKMKEELYPETEEAGVVFDPEQFKKDNPDMEISGYNSNTGGYTFKRREEEEGKPEIDFDRLNKFLLDNNMKLKGVSVNPTTGNLNYSFGAEEIEKPGDKKTWEGNLAKAEQFIKDNPDYEITGTNPDSDSVTISKKGTPGGTTSKFNIDKFLFGDTGIINDFIKSSIDDGVPLEDEDKELILKNYNLRKDTLTEEAIAEVERYFQQIDVDPNAGPKVVLPEGPQSKPKNLLQELLTPPSENLGKGRDKYGYVLGEEKIGLDGKKYKYMGNDEWKPVY